MNKIDFLEQLEAMLRGINVVDRVRSLDYFSEMIDDAMESGMSEEEAVTALGGIDEIAERITQEAPVSPLRGEKPFDGSEKAESSAPVDGEFSSIRVRVRESDVNVLLSEDGESRVDCVDREHIYHRVFEENGVLIVEEVDERRWYERFKGFNKGTEVSIYLPAGEYKKLDIESVSGDIEVVRGIAFESVHAKTLSGDIEFFALVRSVLELSSTSGDVCVEGKSELEALSVHSTSGDVELSGFTCTKTVSVNSTSGDVACRSITSEDGEIKSISGDVNVKDVICANKLGISSTSGDVHFDGCDGAIVLLSSISGDVRGSLLSEKRFEAKTVSGGIRLPKDNSNPNGECKAKTVSGSINISLCK